MFLRPPRKNHPGEGLPNLWEPQFFFSGYTEALEPLSRLLSDGEDCLNALHSQRKIEKVQIGSEQITHKHVQ